MNKSRRRFISVLCMCLMCLLFGTSASAADGQLRFSDPSTTVGAEVEVTAKFSANYGINSVNATLTYDSQYLKYVSGDSTTDLGGQVQLTGNGGGSTEISWTMKFQALKEGDTKITIASVNATDTDGDTISVTEGSSAIQIGAGDPSLISETSEGSATGGGEIEIDGVTYTVSSEIPDILIPEGFEKSDLTYDGQTIPAVKQSAGENYYAVYLKNAEGEEDFFLYDAEKQSFSPFVQVLVSDERYILLLSNDMSKKLPGNLQKTTMTVEGKEFPAWQNMDASAYYVVYAVNSDGTTGFYQYDTLDGTYQRYTPDKVEKTDEENKGLGGIVNKLRANLDKVILVAWGIFLIMVIILIVLAVKLRHRNLELDDLYDEYGIDLDDEEEEAYEDEEPVKETRAEKRARKKEEKKAKKRRDEDLYDFDDEDEEFDDFIESDEDYEGEELEDDYEEDVFGDYDESDLDDEEEIDDLDAMLNARVQKRPKRKTMLKVEEPPVRQVGHSDPSDTFKMDLIDLD